MEGSVQEDDVRVRRTPERKMDTKALHLSREAATARPSPRLPPVTSALRPSREICMRVYPLFFLPFKATGTKPRATELSGTPGLSTVLVEVRMSPRA